MKRLLMIAFALISYTYTYAQKDSLDPVTVTASVSPLKASATGRDIIVVTGDQISKLPVHSLDELLRYIPGLEVQARGPMGSQADITARGSTFQQVLILIDGVRVNDPNSGHFNGYIPVAPAEIERIEILKGAASAIYGSDAVGGVVQIITKVFASKKKTEDDLIKKKREDDLILSGDLAAGEYGLFSTNVGAFVHSGETSVSASLLANTANGEPQRGINGYFHNYTGSVAIGQQLFEHLHAAFRSSYDSRDFAAQNFYTTFISDTAKEKVTAWWHQLNLSYEGNTKFSLDAGYKDLKDRYAFNSLGTPNMSESKLWQLQGRIETGKLVTGLQWLEKSIASNDRGDHHQSYYGAFALYNYQIGRLLIAPSMRLDYNKTSEAALSPQLNISYRQKDWQLRASGGRSIRDADYTERYNNYNKPLVTSGKIGNPNLDPETAWSAEAGADHFIGEALKLSATVFYRKGSGALDYVITPYADMPRKDNLVPAGSYALAKNIAAVRTNGLDVNAQLQTKTWSVITGMMWLNSTSSESQPSFYILSHAKLMSTLSVCYHKSWFTASVTGQYKDRDYLPDYSVWGLRVEGNIIGKKLGVFINADNLFDKHFQDIAGAAMPGQWFSAGIKVKFQQ